MIMCEPRRLLTRPGQHLEERDARPRADVPLKRTRARKRGPMMQELIEITQPFKVGSVHLEQGRRSQKAFNR